MSPKWAVLCQVGRKTLTQSQCYISAVHLNSGSSVLLDPGPAVSQTQGRVYCVVVLLLLLRMTECAKFVPNLTKLACHVFQRSVLACLLALSVSWLAVMFDRFLLEWWTVIHRSQLLYGYTLWVLCCITVILCLNDLSFVYIDRVTCSLCDVFVQKYNDQAIIIDSK